MKEECPTRQIYLFAVVFLAAYLARSYADNCFFLVIIFPASVFQCDVCFVVEKNAVYSIIIQAVGNGRYFCVVDDADQRMLVCNSDIPAVITYVSYFQYFAHKICMALIFKSKNNGFGSGFGSDERKMFY